MLETEEGSVVVVFRRRLNVEDEILLIAPENFLWPKRDLLDVLSMALPPASDVAEIFCVYVVVRVGDVASCGSTCSDVSSTIDGDSTFPKWLLGHMLTSNNLTRETTPPTLLITMAAKSSDGVLRSGYQPYPSPPRTPKCTIYESGGSSQLLCVEIKSTAQTRPTSRPVYSSCNEKDYSKFVSPSKRRVFAETPDEPLFNTGDPIRKELVARTGAISNRIFMIDFDTDVFS